MFIEAERDLLKRLKGIHQDHGDVDKDIRDKDSAVMPRWPTSRQYKHADTFILDRRRLGFVLGHER